VKFFSGIFPCPLGDGDRNRANLDLDKQKNIFILLDGPQGAWYNCPPPPPPPPPPPQGGEGGVGPAGSMPSPGFRTIYIFLIDTIFLALAVQGATVDA